MTHLKFSAIAFLGAVLPKKTFPALFVTLLSVQASGTCAITGHVITGGFFRTRTCRGTIYTIEPFRAFFLTCLADPARSADT